MADILRHVLDTVLKNCDPKDLVQVGIDSEDLKKKTAYWTPLIQQDQLSVERWMIEIAKLLNSQDELRLNESFKITVQYAQPPR